MGFQSLSLQASEAGAIWTLDSAEEALVECHELWRRSPGAGGWPFAGDGPWHLMQGEAGDYAGDGQDGVSRSSRPRVPLDADEVDRRDLVTAWLMWIDREADRRIVWLATASLHHEEGRVPWTAMKRWLDWARTPKALSERYRNALAMIVCRLNGWPTRRARAVAEAGFSRDVQRDGAES